jgi:hypothetical protein
MNEQIRIRKKSSQLRVVPSKQHPCDSIRFSLEWGQVETAYKLVGHTVMGAVLPTRDDMTPFNRTRAMDLASLVVDVQMRSAEVEGVNCVLSPTRAQCAIRAAGYGVAKLFHDYTF